MADNILPPFAPRPAPGIAETIIAPIDYLYIDVLKLGQPWMRAAFTFAVATAAEFFLKPDVMFAGDDTRNWSVLHPSDKEGTVLPWWMIPAASGILSAILI